MPALFAKNLILICPHRNILHRDNPSTAQFILNSAKENLVTEFTWCVSQIIAVILPKLLEGMVIENGYLIL